MKQGVLCCTALLLFAVAACDDGTGGTTTSSLTTSGTGGAGGSGGSSTSSSSSTGTGGAGGTGGTGGGNATGTGHTAMDLVNAGSVMKSPGYTMVYTLGQSTPDQGKSTSPSYRMQGGLIGANGSLP